MSGGSAVAGVDEVGDTTVDEVDEVDVDEVDVEEVDEVDVEDVLLDTIGVEVVDVLLVDVVLDVGALTSTAGIGAETGAAAVGTAPPPFVAQADTLTAASPTIRARPHHVEPGMPRMGQAPYRPSPTLGRHPGAGRRVSAG